MVKIKFLFIAFCCYLLAVSAVVYPLIKKQQQQIFNQQLTVAEKSLKHFAATAGIPLLSNDYIRLDNIIKGSADDNDVDYVAITDKHGKIKAHTDSDRLDSTFVPAADVISLDLTTRDYRREIFKQLDHAGIIDLIAEVTFNKKNIGFVHLGLSAGHLQEQLSKAKLQALKTLFLPSLLIFVVIGFWVFKRRKKYYQCYSQAEKIDGKPQKSPAVSLENDNKNNESLVSDLNQFTHNSSLTKVLSQPVNSPTPYASRKQATILFAGIKNFNEYAGDGNPEDIIHALNEYIRLASDVISSHGGYVDKIIGDAVIGIFGVSVYRTDHSERAVRAAYQLQQQLLTASLAQKNPLLGMVRIGISSGVVLSGNIGAHSKVEYSSIGESIKEAFWLNNAAGQAEILLGQNVYNLCRDFVEVEHQPPLTLLGLSAVVECYRLTGLK